MNWSYATPNRVARQRFGHLLFLAKLLDGDLIVRSTSLNSLVRTWLAALPRWVARQRAGRQMSRKKVVGLLWSTMFLGTRHYLQHHFLFYLLFQILLCNS